MGIFEIFGKGSANDSEAKLKIAQDGEGMLSGLSLRQVMDAHSAWKGKLQKVLEGVSDENFDIVEVSGDCHCFLGKWIYGAGKAYSRMPEYESLRRAHANFHLCAGEVLTQHILGNREESERLLKIKFRSTSNRNQLELVRLFTAAKR